MNELIARINNFDSYYEMSDSFQVTERGSYEKQQIKQLLSEVPKEQYKELEKGLNKAGLFNYKRYFI